MSRVARRPFSSLPRCWNRNESIVADGSCRSPVDGSPLPLCIELAVTQTNFIVECANEFKADPHCGTFLEVHRPGFAEKISEARLRAMYPSGYRMTVLSTTYKGDQARTLCYDALKKGRFELWWVQRTRYNFVVERRIPFSVSSPECDWDDSNNRYLPYATLFLPDGVTRRARQLAGLDPFDAKNLLFTRQRVEGTAAFPGVGMGSTLVPIGPDTYPPGAAFDAATWHNAYTYAFAPIKPAYTVSGGVIAPSSAEQTALALLTAKRGYRRLEDAPPEVQAAMLSQVRAAAAAEASEAAAARRASAQGAGPAGPAAPADGGGGAEEEAAVVDDATQGAARGAAGGAGGSGGGGGGGGGGGDEGYGALRESWRAAAREEAEGGAALLEAEAAARRARAEAERAAGGLAAGGAGAGGGDGGAP